MPDPATSMGGARADFPSTLWSEVLAARDAERPETARPHLDRLIQAYWKPIYACIRVFWGASSEQAKDHTQEFFLSLLDRGTLVRVDPSKGTFRSYLKACLRYFMLDEAKRAGAARRSAALIPLSAGEADLEQLIADTRCGTPEETFDRAWTACVLDLALARTADQLSREGRGRDWEIFKAFDLDASDADYAALAGRVGATERQVKTALQHVRRRLRQSVRDVIAESCRSADDADREFAEFLRVSGAAPSL